MEFNREQQAEVIASLLEIDNRYIIARFFSDSRLSYETIDRIIEKMPEVWTNHLDDIAWKIRGNVQSKYMYPHMLLAWIDAEYFFDYLWEHQEWGWVAQSCNHCNVNGKQMHWTHPCEQCGAIGGKIKHPALVLMEKYRGEK